MNKDPVLIGIYILLFIFLISSLAVKANEPVIPEGELVTYKSLYANDLQQCYMNSRDYTEEECGKLLREAKEKGIGIIFLKMGISNA